MSKIYELLLNAMGRRNLIDCIKVLPGFWMEMSELHVRRVGLMSPLVDGREMPVDTSGRV